MNNNKTDLITVLEMYTNILQFGNFATLSSVTHVTQSCRVWIYADIYNISVDESIFLPGTVADNHLSAFFRRQAEVVQVLRARVAGQCDCMSSAVQSPEPVLAPLCSPTGMVRAREDFRCWLQNPYAFHVNTRKQPIRERGDRVIGESQNGSP